MTATKDPDNRTYNSWVGRDAYDIKGDKIGEIDHIFYDDRTQRPEWLAVKTGLFGTKTTFVPINGSKVFNGDDLQVPFTKAFVKDAPRIDADETMSHPQELELWSYYGYDYAATSSADSFGYGKVYTQSRADNDFASDWDPSWTPREERLRRYEAQRAASRR
jgi:PRC-barrel domain